MNHPAEFPAAAGRIFRQAGSTPAPPVRKGCQYLLTMLLAQNLLPAMLLDPAIPVSVCIWMAQTATGITPHFRMQLSDTLQENLLEGEPEAVSKVMRLLHILSSTMEPESMAPLLRKILVHRDPQIRSKAMVLIGRSQSGISAIERLMPDPDARIRANALESLWNSKDPRAVALFREYLGDASNRVAGNAILGLYWAGYPESIEPAVRMAEHRSAIFRATAAWVMGTTGDPRFIPLLGKLLAESNGQVRKIVFQALQASRKSGTNRSARGIDLQLRSAYRHRGRARARVRVTDAETGKFVSLPATAFIVGDPQQPVADYACEPVCRNGSLFDFILPRLDENQALHRAASAAIDEFCIKAPQRVRSKVVEFSSWPASREVYTGFRIMGVDVTDLPAQAQVPELAGLFGTLTRILEKSSRGSEHRHVIALCHSCPDWEVDAERSVIDQAQAADALVHFLSLRPNEQLERVARNTGGSFQVLPSADRIGDALGALREDWECSYLIDAPASALQEAESGRFCIQAFSETAYGRCAMAFMAGVS